MPGSTPEREAAAWCCSRNGRHPAGVSGTWDGHLHLDSWEPATELHQLGVALFPSHPSFPSFRFEPPKLEDTSYQMLVRSAARWTCGEAKPLHHCKSR